MHYFAYGSNLNASRMRDRCGIDVEYWGNHVLRAHRLILDESGVATVVPDPRSSVYGVLWTVDDVQLDALDRCEGVPTYYERQRLGDLGDDFHPDAAIYISQRATSENAAPRPGYIDLLIAGGEDAGDGRTPLPDWWHSDVLSLGRSGVPFMAPFRYDDLVEAGRMLGLPYGPHRAYGFGDGRGFISEARGSLDDFGRAAKTLDLSSATLEELWNASWNGLLANFGVVKACGLPFLREDLSPTTRVSDLRTA